MTLQQIECFLEVAKHNRFSIAATNLYLSQPTLSRQIASLEEELSVQLFIRSKNTVQLSDIGKTLLPKFEALYQSFYTSAQDILDTVNQFSDHLNIGIQEDQYMDASINRVLKIFKKENSATAIQLKNVDLEESYAGLMNGSLDCLLALNITIPETEHLSRFVLFSDYMALAVPAAHENAGLSSIAYEDIPVYFGDLPLVNISIHRFESPLHSQLEDGLRGLMSAEPTFLNTKKNALNTLRLSVEQNLAISCFNAHSVVSLNPNVCMIPLEFEGNNYAKLEFIWNCENTNSALAAFVKVLSQNYK